jgi:protein-disulfide isomerase
MHDALFAGQARLEDPHLWARASEIGLDLVQFNADRRSPAVAKRVEKDFRAGLRAGVATTPALFVDGAALAGRPTAGQLEELASGS